MFCDGAETCEEAQCQQGTAPVCNDGLFCNGVESCNEGIDSCQTGTKVDCSVDNLTGINSCTNNPDNNPSTQDLRESFASTCNEQSDSCTTGNAEIGHLCAFTCGADAQCNGVAPGTNNCTINCEYKPQFECQRDGEFGVGFEEGHQYVCDEDNTYFECNQNQSAYVHVNTCSYYCSADLACNGGTPGNSLESCLIYGQDYLEDYCDDTCQIQEDTCESDLTGCKSDVECDELIPGTNECSNKCTIDRECTKDSDCSDRLFCNGAEVCNLETNECEEGQQIDCSAFNLPEIGICSNVPDGNPYTLDNFIGFTSTCSESSDACTLGSFDFTHTCNIDMCGAECNENEDCGENECDQLDGCVGRDYYNYDDVANSCNSCSCVSNECNDVVIYENDVRCEEICMPEEFERISYSSRDTGNITHLDGYNEFQIKNIDFFHGYVYEDDSKFFGFGSLHARATSANGTEIQLNVKFDVTDLLEYNCEYATWRNYARGTYWIDGVGTETITYDYMDITYYFNTGKIDAEGVGSVAEFDFEDIMDNRF